MSRFRVVEGPLNVEEARRQVEGAENGAVVLFLGTVRARTHGRAVTHLVYEAYAPMATAQMERLATEVAARHGATAIACHHRVGRLAIGDTALVLAVSSPHRAAALRAVDDYVARLKEDVPIWKREHFEDGAVWVGTPDDPQGTRAFPAPPPAGGPGSAR
jgi:molybdopterin synthase catalytic subunit